MGLIFDPYDPNELTLLSTAHLTALGIVIGVALLLYFFRKAIRERPTLAKGIKYTIIAMLVLPEISIHIWYVYYDIWDITVSLPLELCSLSQLLGIVMLLTRSRLLFHFMFFAGIIGAIQAMATPSIGYTFPHFRFVYFYIVHLGIVLSALYMVWIEKYRPTWKSIGITMLLLNIIAVIMIAVNYVLGANYMFLMHKPDTASLLDVLGPHPIYIFVEEFVALLFFVVVYAMFYEVPKWVKRANRTR